jgi:AraC family transcriptional regulator, positive regulator of tynA and feaB
VNIHLMRAGSVALALPGVDFGDQRLSFADAPVQTLTAQHADLDLHHVCDVGAIDETPESGKTVAYDCRIACEIAVTGVWLTFGDDFKLSWPLTPCCAWVTPGRIGGVRRNAYRRHAESGKFSSHQALAAANGVRRSPRMRQSHSSDNATPVETAELLLIGLSDYQLSTELLDETERNAEALTRRFLEIGAAAVTRTLTFGAAAVTTRPAGGCGWDEGMRTLVTTKHVPPAEALDSWVEAVRVTIRHHDLEPLCERRCWWGELKAAPLHDLTLATWRAAPGISHNHRGDGDHLLLFPPSSRCGVELGGEWFEHNRRNFCLMNTDKPSSSRSLEPIERVAVRIPREVLSRRIHLTKQMLNHALPLRDDSMLLMAFVEKLVRIDLSTLSVAAATMVREQMIDLTAVVLGDLAGTMPRLGAAARFGTLKLRHFIESQLTNPAADAQSIAAGAGVSERHANRLLALEGTSIRRLLIERRLNKCREMIEDPQHMNRSISDIAFFYGFRNLSHFTRVFKGRFGLSPSEHRRAPHPARH